MTELIFYNTNVVTHDDHNHLAGIAKFRKFFGIYPKSSVFVDRSGTVKIPVRVTSLFPIPTLRKMRKSYEDICNERAIELLKRARAQGSVIHVAWSGGIDSTLLLISLLKHATPEDRSRMTVLLTEESIFENPNFYAEHIRGKLRCDSMTMFPYLLGTANMIIGGENNDQVFGSDMIAKLINNFGPAIIHEKYRREVFFDFFESRLQDKDATNFCVDLIERIAKNASVPLSTHFDYLWWLNFSVKWQCVAIRMLPYTTPKNAPNITKEYIETRYVQFYNTEDFQLWSMNNMDKKIKDTWDTYKWPAKEIIYEYTQDEDYRKNKQKRGSLASVFIQQRSYNFIDSSFKLHYEMDASEYYNPDNDFK